jgi:hypothetical protein
VSRSEQSRVDYLAAETGSPKYSKSNVKAMTDQDDPLSDEHLERLLQPLRNMDVPPEAQAANRAAIAQLLAARIRTRWWKRTIAVPVPLAVAASIILLLATVTLVRHSPIGHTVDQRSSLTATQQPNGSRLDTNVASSEPIARAWSIQRSFIRALTSSATSESVAHNALENRDDS